MTRRSRPPRPAAVTASLVAAILVAATAIGCGPRRAAVHPVSGEVRMGGRPCPLADVTFVPTNGRPALAQTDAQGRFTLRTWADGDGAVAGEHVVCIVKHGESARPPKPVAQAKPAAPDDPYAEAMRPNVAPADYASPVTSPLRATVVPGRENHFRFDLDAK